MIRSFSLLLIFLALSPGSGNAENQPAFSTGGTPMCLGCHRDERFRPARDAVHGNEGNPAAPFASDNHGCESCHGPSATHVGLAADGSRPAPAVTFSEAQTPAAQDRTCLGCHKAAVSHWQGSAHEFEGVTCVSCHTVHDNSHQLVRDDDRACLDCHREIRADLKRKSVHPLAGDAMACTDCHDPHGGAGPGLLNQASVNDNCYECHAALRGPFLFEHAPVREDCLNCHVPHGANHEPLLQSRTPWMCQQCHLAQFHPSTLLDGTERPPRGASQSMLGKDCMNCHSKVHGSNHPSGAGLIR